MEKLTTLWINGPDDCGKYGGVILEVTNGEKVLAHLKVDGTLLLAGVQVAYVDELEPLASIQAKLDARVDLGGKPVKVPNE